MNTDPVQDWLRIHRELARLEAEFTDLALKAVDGSIPREELDARRQVLMATRELCTAAYERAFPKPTQ